MKYSVLFSLFILTNLIVFFATTILADNDNIITLEGTVFHDMNGNGERDISYGINETENPKWWRDLTDNKEPVLDNVSITFGEHKIKTNVDGQYSIDLERGKYNVLIEKKGYRYFFDGNDFVHKITNGIPININSDTHMNFPIGVGLLTLPYPKQNHEITTLYMYTDLSPADDKVSRYNKSTDHWVIRKKPGAGDKKRGLEFQSIPYGPVIAAAPGIVTKVQIADDGYYLLR